VLSLRGMNKNLDNRVFLFYLTFNVKVIEDFFVILMDLGRAQVVQRGKRKTSSQGNPGRRRIHEGLWSGCTSLEKPPDHSG